MPSPTRSFCIDPLGSSSQDLAVMGGMPYVEKKNQREHASQLVRGLQAFYDSTAFVMNWDGRANIRGG